MPCPLPSQSSRSRKALLSLMGEWAPYREADPGKAPLLGSLVTALVCFTPQLSSGSPYKGHSCSPWAVGGMDRGA